MNNDGMIRLSPHNQPVFILPHELVSIKQFLSRNEKRINLGMKGTLVLIITFLSDKRWSLKIIYAGPYHTMYP